MAFQFVTRFLHGLIHFPFLLSLSSASSVNDYKAMYRNPIIVSEVWLSLVSVDVREQL